QRRCLTTLAVVVARLLTEFPLGWVCRNQHRAICGRIPSKLHRKMRTGGFNTGAVGSPDRTDNQTGLIRPVADYAVVAGLDLNGLGVVRALARAGIAVAGLDSDLNKPTAATRHGVKLRVNMLSGDEFIAELIRLRTLFGSSPVLFLTQEASVRTVSAAREKLAGIYRFTLPP